MLVYLSFSLIFVFLFFVLMQKEKRTMLTGMCVIGSFYCLALSIDAFRNNGSQFWQETLWLLILLPGLATMAIRILFALLETYRGRFHIRKILALVLIILTVTALVTKRPVEELYGDRKFFIIVGYLYFFVDYVIFALGAYILSSFLCQMHKPLKNLRYLVVLGSSLTDEEYEPAFHTAKRVAKAVEVQKKYPDTKVIFTGGLGDDVRPSEALSMKRYALSLGLEEASIVLEEEAKDTIQNIVYSRPLMADTEGIFAIVTNHYHILRAGIIARKEGLASESFAISGGFFKEVAGFLDDFYWACRTNGRDFFFGLSVASLLYFLDLLIFHRIR